MGLLGVSLLTIAGLGVTFLAALVRLWRNPPVLNVYVVVPEVAGKLVLNVPEKLFVQTQRVLSDAEAKPVETPIPEDILVYIDMESELHAREARKKRVRALFADTGNWDAAFRMLQREDNPE